MSSLKPQPDRVQVQKLPSAHGRSSFADDVRAGMRTSPKSLPPKYFYDELGSHLFEAICWLPEYYVTRAERAIFDAHSAEIADALGPVDEIIELGSGSSAKTAMLLTEVVRRRPVRYRPIDISESALERAAEQLVASIPNLSVDALAAEYTAGLRRLESDSAIVGHRRAAMFIGSSVGNLEPDEQASLLRRVRAAVGETGSMLLGTDLVKPVDVLVPAYDDTLGVTAAFNLNVLVRINRELGGNFDLRTFYHEAVFEPSPARIEIRLVSRATQSVAIRDLDMTVQFEEEEYIHTESCYKFDARSLRALAAAGGFELRTQWTDPQELFSLSLLEARFEGDVAAR